MGEARKTYIKDSLASGQYIMTQEEGDCALIKQQGDLIEKQNDRIIELKAQLAALQWIPISIIPPKVPMLEADQKWIEFINPEPPAGGSIGGICLGTYTNIKYIKQNYTYYRILIIPPLPKEKE